jgi:CHAT domain-containing protein/Tfp pilus assembly protein PilF
LNPQEEFHDTILQLAENYQENIEKFIDISEKYMDCYPGAWHNKGHFYEDVGHVLLNSPYHKMAFNLFDRALTNYKQADENFAELDWYLRLGKSYIMSGKQQEATHYLAKSLAIAKEKKNRKEEAQCYLAIGAAYSISGNYQEARESCEEALKIFKSIGDDIGESHCYRTIGATYESQGQSQKAMEQYEKYLRLIEDTKDQKEVVLSNLLLATSNRNLARFQNAIEHIQKALSVAEEFGERNGDLRGNCLVEFGLIRFDLGQYQEAIGYYEEALQEYEVEQNPYYQATCLMNIGSAYNGLHNHQKAIEYFQKALSISEKLEDVKGKSLCTINLGIAYAGLRQHQKAIEYFQKALAFAENMEDYQSISYCYVNIGIAYAEQGQHQKTLEYCNKAISIINEKRNYFLLLTTYSSLGRLFLQRDPKKAYEYLKQSLDLSELIGERIVEQEHKMALHSRVSDDYELMVLTCLQMSNEKKAYEYEAYEYAERSKSRAFLELMATADRIKPTIPLTNKFEALLQKENNHLAKIRQIQMRALKDNQSTVEPGETEHLKKQLESIYNEIDKIDSKYASLRRIKTISVEQIQKILGILGNNAVLVEYFVTYEKTFIFVVTPEGFHVIPAISENTQLSKSRLSAYIDNYFREVVGYTLFDNIVQTWLELSKYLIDPISEYISKANLVYFVPHSVFHYLPLHALELDANPIIKGRPVLYLPSATLLQFYVDRNRRSLKTCSAFAIQERQQGYLFSREAESVANLFGGKALVDVDKKAVVENSEKDILHFATHGNFNFSDALSSGIALRNETLTAKELFSWSLNVGLITLSACQTGVNKTGPGDELIGLTRSLLYAGARSVIASLWSVYDDSTIELMTTFYSLLKDSQEKSVEPISKATALQLAQIKIMENKEHPKWKHPYYWAPFILVGDWK